MAKVAQLADENQEQEVPSQDTVHPDQGSDLPARVQTDGIEMAVQDPPST